jgi:RHS repeat-associated protein
MLSASRDCEAYPFGETRLTTGTIYTDKLFTGQREIAGLGIYHYNARFYSPVLGRFLSADTIVPGYANPQNLNRYAYVNNNPLRYTDPTGHIRVENEGGGGSIGCSNSDDCQDGKPKPYEELRPKDNKTEKKPWVYSVNISEGIHLGPSEYVFFPDYADDSYNGLPYSSGPVNTDDNFFIAFDVYYNEFTGSTMSDIQTANHYDGPLVVHAISVNDADLYGPNQNLFTGNNNGSYMPVSNTGGSFRGDQSINVRVELYTIFKGGHGKGAIPAFINLHIPSLVEVKHLIETGNLLPLP